MEPAGVRLGAERKARSRRRVAAFAGGCGVLALLVLPALYWKAVNYVQPFELPERSLPSPNGYDVAVRAAGRMPTDSAWLSTVIALDSPQQVAPLTTADWERITKKQRPALLAVRRAFSLRWQVPRPEPNLRAAAAGCFALEWSLDAIEFGGNLCRGGAVVDRYAGQRSQELGLREAERIVPRLSGGGLLRAAARVRRRACSP